MVKICFDKNGIYLKKEPLRIIIGRNGISVSDGVPPDEAVEWITANGTHIPLNSKGEQIGGPKIGEKGAKGGKKEVPATPHKITSTTKHLVALKDGEKPPAHIEKEIGKKIPPHWRNVMVSPDPKANLQVIGKDAKDRTQYIYRKEYVEQKQAEKFERVQKLISNKEKIMANISALRKKDPDSADCLTLIAKTGLRPGSTKDTKAEKEALGATTLKGRNVVQEGNKVFLRFTGKKGVNQDHEIKDPSLKRMLIDRKKNAGDDGKLFKTSAEKINKSLPKDVHAKDFRTMVAQETAGNALKGVPPAKNVREFEKMRNSVGDTVSKKLGNTRTVALNSYINPVVFKQHSPKAYAEWEAKQNGKT